MVDLADQTGLDLLVVRRPLSPGLAALNRAGALNGHVPITAILSLIAVVGSFLYGYDTIVMAVERSASEETATVDGVPVNHQYSKSLDFERPPGRPDLGHHRPRPASTARPCARTRNWPSPAPLPGSPATTPPSAAATRCSASRAAADDGWCGNCPKCRFVGLMLAPFLEPAELTAIIGRDMFADPDQVPGFAALMSDDDKPFECVGERRESAAAIRILSDLPAWKDAVVVAALADRARAMVSDCRRQRSADRPTGPRLPRPGGGRGVDRLLTEAA